MISVARPQEGREKGIKQGRRPELQGGGLDRSAGGDTSVLSPKDKENRELSDQRVLGSGDFVGAVLQESERLLEKKYNPKRTIDDLIAVVADKVGISPELICSGSRQRKYSEARALVAYMTLLKRQGILRLRWQGILESDGLMSSVQQRRGVKSIINSTTRGLSKELRFE